MTISAPSAPTPPLARRPLRRSRALCLLLSTVVLSFSIGPVPEQAEAQERRQRAIGERDAITLSVFEASEFNGTFRVDERGEINHPILGPVAVGGLSRGDAEKLFTEMLESRFLQEGRATVNVEISESRSQAIHVIGAVRSPGELEFSGSWTLIEAITAAGGLTSEHGDSIFVFRRASNGLTDQLEVSARDLFQRADPTVNLPLAPQDLVNIPETVEITLYCMGEVNAPGALTFNSNERITLLAAIARAGGLTDRAKKKVIIQRQTDDGESVRIEADYKSIVEGRARDVELQAGDVITVEVSFL